MVRLPAPRRDARPRHLRQGRQLGLRAPGRRRHQRGDQRDVQRPRLPRRAHLLGPPAGLRRRGRHRSRPWRTRASSRTPGASATRSCDPGSGRARRAHTASSATCGDSASSSPSTSSATAPRSEPLAPYGASSPAMNELVAACRGRGAPHLHQLQPPPRGAAVHDHRRRGAARASPASTARSARSTRTTPARDGRRERDAIRVATLLRELGHDFVARELDDADLDALADEVERLLAARARRAPVRERRRPRERRRARSRMAVPAEGRSRSTSSSRDSIVSGRANPMGLGALLWREGDVAVMEVTLGRAFEGAPGAPHGGVVAALVDETMGLVMGMQGRARLHRDRSTSPSSRPRRSSGRSPRAPGSPRARGASSPSRAQRLGRRTRRRRGRGPLHRGRPAAFLEHLLED